MYSLQNDHGDPENDQECIDGIDPSMWPKPDIELIAIELNVRSLVNLITHNTYIKKPVRIHPNNYCIIIDRDGHAIHMIPKERTKEHTLAIGMCMVGLINKG
jgi:hypothetical protein